MRTCKIIDRYHPKILYFDWCIHYSSCKPYLKKRFENKFTVECQILEWQIGKERLEISVSKADDWLYFTVYDDGKGMDEIQLKSLRQQCEKKDRETVSG